MRALLIVAATGCWTSTSSLPPTTVTHDPRDPVVAAIGANVLPHQSAEALITPEQVREITNFTDPLEVAHNEPTTPTYDDVHFKATGKPEPYDVMLRVWTLDRAAASTK